MINIFEVTETNKMVEKENLDVRTITMGINLLDCASENLDEVNEKIYKKITTLAKDLVSTGESIAKEFGVPIVNGYFNMMMIVDLTGCSDRVSEVIDQLANLGKEIGVDIRLQREDIFDNMHRI